MKVIFLDIDGPLNVYGEGERDKYGAQFHSHLVNNLKHLIEQTNAKIVISSSWRFSGLPVMQSMWLDRNLPGEVIDITPDCVDICESGLFEHYDHVERGHEIQHWLNHHPEVTNYVIIDDDPDMLESQLNNFVKCSGNITHSDYVDGGGYGLTKECTEQAIKILNKK